MDKIPNIPVDRSKEVENRAKLLAVQEKARAFRPVTTGQDILASIDSRTGERNYIDVRTIGSK